MSPEVTYDPQAGEAFVSHNGAPIEEAPTPPIDEEITEQQELPFEETLESDDLEEEESSYTPNQQVAINKLTSMGMDVEAAFAWADSDESTLSDDTYNRLADALGDSDPSVVELSALALGFAKSNPDWIASECESFSQTQEQALVDCVGGEHTSTIVNLGYKISSGEIDVSDAYKQVAQQPELRNAFIKAAKAGLLSIHL